jgi:tetratricopeptide (TPR) repeat protein
MSPFSQSRRVPVRWPLGRLRRSFEAGRFSQIVDWAESALPLFTDSNGRVQPGSEWVYAAAVMTGRWDLSGHIEQLLQSQARWPGSTARRFRLYWVIGRLRRSQYAETRLALLKWLRRERRLHPNGKRGLSFELLQAIALERFFADRLSAAHRWANRALRVARERSQAHNLVLASDLLGHSLLKMGLVRESLQALRQARRRAHRLGSKSFSSATLLTILEIRAQMGLFPSALTALRVLSQALQKLKPEDSYSRSQLSLALANLWVLAGRADRAREICDRAATVILSSSHHRQRARLHLILAHLEALKNRIDDSLDHLALARSELDTKRDRSLILKVQEFRSRLARSGLNWASDVDQSARPRGSPVREQDHLGELIVSARGGDRSSLMRLADLGYWYFLWESLHPAGEAILAFDTVPGTVLLAKDGHITFIDRGLGDTLRNLLIQLNGTGATKEELIERVWGYRYDPIRHDVLVHSSLSRLRKLLRERGVLITRRGDRYLLRERFKVVAALAIDTRSEEAERSGPEDDGISSSLLSWRQTQIIHWIGDETRAGRSVGVARLAERFAVSHRSALRDLSALVSQRHLVSRGRGRATTYQRPQD